MSFFSNTSKFYQEQIELPFLKHYLKDDQKFNLPKAYVFETGTAYGITPAGMLALDVARIEAGLLLIEVDYFSSRHAFIEVVPAGENIRLFGVHLSALHAAWTERRRLFEVRSLLRSIEAHQHGFHILAGDFNTVAPTEKLDVRRLPARRRGRG